MELEENKIYFVRQHEFCMLFRAIGKAGYSDYICKYYNNNKWDYVKDNNYQFKFEGYDIREATEEEIVLLNKTIEYENIPIAFTLLEKLNKLLDDVGKCKKG